MLREQQYYNISEVIDIKVISNFAEYDAPPENFAIASFDLVEMTDTSL